MKVLKDFFIHKKILKKEISFFVYYSIFLSILFFVSFLLMLATLIRMPDNIQMPNFSSLFIAEALEIATKEKLNVRISSKFDNEIPRGYVITQKPEPGMTIRPGRRITLITSKGPSLENIPSLVGKPLEQARSEIYSLYAKYGYTPNIVEQRETSLEIAIGSITKQFPQAGNSMDLETPIILVVSEGETLSEIIVENYVGKHYKEVVKQLESLRISVTLKEVPVPEESSVGIILEQSIEPKEILKEGDQIVLSVGTGKNLSSVKTKNSLHMIVMPYDLFSPPVFIENIPPELSIPSEENKNYPPQKLVQWKTVEIFLEDSVSKRKIYHNSLLCGEKVYIPYKYHGEKKISVLINGKLSTG